MPKLVSITEVFNSVFLLVRRRDDGTYGVLLITAIPSLQQSIFPFDRVSPGIFRFCWVKEELKTTILLLRGLGVLVFVYEFGGLKEWSAPLGTLSTSDVDRSLHEIAAALPECRTYVEVFGGRSPLLLARQPAPVEVINDYNRAVISLFRVLRDPEFFCWFYLLSKTLPPSTQFISHSLWQLWQEFAEVEPALASYAWYCYARPSLANIELPSVPDTIPEEAPKRILSALCSVDPRLIQLHNRLFRVQIEHNTIETIFKIYDSDNTLFWLDVPFDGEGALDLEGTYILLSYLDNLEGAVAIYQNGGYPNPHVRQLMCTDGPWLKWNHMKFRNSTVYLKPATA